MSYRIRDLHHALRVDPVRNAQGDGIAFSLTKLTYGKDDVAYALHASPNMWTVSGGIQSSDVLAFAGFTRQDCPIFPTGCYAKQVGADYPLDEFIAAFSSAKHLLVDAERHLGSCGLYLPGTRRSRHGSRGGGDGHTASESRLLKQGQDDYFLFRMTFGHFGAERGWVFHYRAQNPPLTPEIWAAMEFLDAFREFPQCPEFEFEPCVWRFVSYGDGDDFSPLRPEVDYAHGIFDAHRQHFSVGLKMLLDAHAALVPFGASFLTITSDTPVGQPAAGPGREVIMRGSAAPPRRAAVAQMPQAFDVAVSFAGPERGVAEELAGLVRAAGFEVFYDDYYPEHLWGKDLAVFFDEIYRKRSSYCVIFVSKEYLDRAWTNHERRSAQAKAVELRGGEYILPIRVDDSELPGLPPTVGYVSLRERSVGKIAEMLVRKLQNSKRQPK